MAEYPLTWGEYAITLTVFPANDLPHLFQRQLLHQNKNRCNLIGKPETKEKFQKCYTDRSHLLENKENNVNVFCALSVTCCKVETQTFVILCDCELTKSC